MPTTPYTLAEILNAVTRPGSFFADGVTEIYAPKLEVEGVGSIGLPLLPIQAEQLVAVAERAPYGKGEETLVDPDVRRTWQIGAGQVHIGGKHWAQNLEEIVALVSAKLGVEGPVSAELYKLLVYDSGSFFVSHRDTEKAPGMFATLVIVLPSLYAGGELLVRHRGEEVRLNLNVSEPSEVAYAAFYADCVHEVLPITSGCRLTLIYNLLRFDQGQQPEPPDYGEEHSRLGEWLRQWGEKSGENEGPEKLIYPLEHAYTQAELSFTALKGADAARGAVAVAASEQAECDLHLALITIEESGYAEHAYYPSRRGRYRYEEDDDEFEIGEVEDREQYLCDWRKPDGSQPPLANLPFKEEELCMPDVFEGMEPDDQHFHEATGNEGASFERTYRRAALVFWPRSRRLAVLNQAGLSLTLPYLNDLAERWAQVGDGYESALWREAHELSGHMLRTWPREGYYHRHTNETSTMLGALWQLRDHERIETFLVEVSATGIYGMGDNENLVKAAGLLALRKSAELIERIIAKNAAIEPNACADLLARCTKASWTSEQMTSLTPAAKAMASALPGDPRKPPPDDYRRRPTAVKPHLVVDLMTALERIESALAIHAADCLLARPNIFSFDAVLVPALLNLAGTGGVATACLRDACLYHLRARICEPLEPPRDWTRTSSIACQCRHCSELGRFLADPKVEEWSFKAAQHDRTHVENSIRQSSCDLNFRTEKRGSPHRLVCVKNQASHERRLAQRKKDLEDLAALELAGIS